MSSKIWLINLVLTVFVVFFGIKAYGVWSKGDRGFLETGSIQKPLPWPEKKISKRNMLPESDYEIVVSHNLFSHLRSEVKPEEEKKTLVRKTETKAAGRFLKLLEWTHQRTNLYGVIIVDDHREALIGEVPANRGKSTGEMDVKRAKVGDIVGRFKVKDIKNTSVVLTAGGYEWPVSLFDKDKPKKRVPLKKETGPIIIDAGIKSTVGVVSKREKTKEKALVPVNPKKKIVDKDPNRRRALPVPKRTASENDKDPNRRRVLPVPKRSAPKKR